MIRIFIYSPGSFQAGVWLFIATRRWSDQGLENSSVDIASLGSLSPAAKHERSMKQFVESIGQWVLDAIEGVGQFSTLFFETLFWALRPPYRFKLLINSMEFVGVGSLFIVLLTGLFTGAVFSLQGAIAFRLFNAESMVGSTVALSLARELSPVLTGLMVTGRAGSGIATELGTMRVTEQIDALYTMAVSPVQYLVVPRFLAGLIVVPALCALFTLVGMLGSYVVGVSLLNIDEGAFLSKVYWFVDPADLFSGLIKAFFFGGILTLVGCYKGFYASGGARGVGIATTQAVVVSSVTILIADYFLTAAMF